MSRTTRRLSWNKDGLAGSTIFRMKFVPEAKTK